MQVPFLPPANEVAGSHVSSRVCLFTGRGLHAAIIHDAVDLTVQDPPAPPLC